MTTKQTPFKDLAKVFAELEATASNLAMIDILANFLPTLQPEEGRIAAYFVRGQIAPEYKGLELGLAEKLVIRAVAQAVNTTSEKVTTAFHKKGDLGLVAEGLLEGKRGAGLSIHDIFIELEKVAKSSGEGSQEGKINLLKDLLAKCSPQEAKYVVRLVVGTLRLGVAEMTWLYGLSKALAGSKEKKAVLEAAYNVLSDLGEVTFQALKSGIKGVEHAKPVIGVPVRMMAAQRIEELEEVKKHIPGEVFVEYKYDGERIQAHIASGGAITLFSRRHENITHQFPDVTQALKRTFAGKEAIVEGEAVAVDKKTGKLQHFQVLMTRRRKHGVEEYVAKVPVRYFLFDILMKDGRSLLENPLSERKSVLEHTFAKSETVVFAEYVKTDDLAEVERFFDLSTKRGAEGVMIKDAGSIYEAGHRGWKWIKFKKDYEAELADTFDLVVVGGLHGSGRRAGTYGSLLVAAYDPQANKYYSCTKVGAGFTDEDLGRLRKKLDKFKLPEKHRLVETGMKPDVWFEPTQVLEVAAAEITVSPVHTVAQDRVKTGGLALRFPRFLRWREDKTAEQATTVKEIYDLYTGARKKK